MILEELVKYLRALVLLQVGFSGTGAAKPEVLLAKAGFTHKEIAELLSKSQAAVAKAISRAKTPVEESHDE